MIRYYITDRKQTDLLACIERNLARGVEWIQIRERDLPGRELAILVRRVMAMPNPHGTRFLVNDRADVALACGAHGVHLRSKSLPPRELRRFVPAGFLIGVSCHGPQSVRDAENEGADFAVYGPVFAPLSKITQTEPVGIEGLATACRGARIPVLALGGITWTNAQRCMDAGAAGVAGITLFQTIFQTG